MLDYTVRYSGQVVAGDPNYPQGKARNIGTPGDGTGTPFEKDLVNDIWGALQALVLAAGIAISGAVENANVSDVRDAVLLLAEFNSAKRRGVVGDGLANDLPKINDAIAAIAAMGGGRLYFGPGRYRIVGSIALSPLVELYFEPGLVTLAQDHPTANMFDFGNSLTYATPVTITGVALEGDQVNTGIILYSNNSLPNVRLVRCSMNVAANNLHGLLEDGFATRLEFDGCTMISASIAGTPWMAPFALVMNQSRLVAAPGATAPLVGATNTKTIDKTLFEHNSVGGGVYLIDATTGSTQCSNATFQGAGSSVFAFKLDGANLFTSGNRFAGNTTPYSRISIAASPSDIQLLGMTRQAIVGTSVTIPDAVRGSVIESVSASPPQVTLPKILFIGQSLSVVVRNNHGSSNWGAAVTFVAQGSENVFYNTALTGLADQQAFTMRFESTNYNGSPAWVQIGDVMTLP